MSSNGENTDPTKSSSSHGEIKDDLNKLKKKGWSNPALRMLGIPRTSLPSRNWMIFWSLLAGVGGAIAYDVHEQKQVREKWMQKMESLGEVPYDTSKLPRKISIFISPFPDDYLDLSLKLFRKFIKPVLNASAVDFEVYTENRQGEIRHAVADKIRELRRSRLEETMKRKETESEEKREHSWKKFFRNDILGIMKRKEKEDKLDLKSVHDLYKPTDVLGFYYMGHPVHVEREDKDVVHAGGVICIGRGAYKEYMNGVHEGLLGPLEKPSEPTSDEPTNAQMPSVDLKQEEVSKMEPVSDVVATPTPTASIQDDTDKYSESSQNPAPEQAKESDSATEEQLSESEKTEIEEKKKIMPFIKPDQYKDAPLAPELNFHSIIRNDKDVPVLFEQPVYVFPLPKVTGIRNWPRKIYNFFVRRYLAEDYVHKTASIVDNISRPYEYKDQFMGKEEEIFWPKKWVKLGKERNSEWVQDLLVDDRIVSRMRVFEVRHDETSPSN